ncbi:cytochrome c oxidase cbb3-type subunit 4 [Modicisalibacter muralis]|uniref:Cytochrome c oxidase cbb3-type subunit 4 n=1 Tax=Modicisalibacter muralis TaxID=119000 RepID=A0A1G9IX21_9GAMM|nr:cbb3-type cytochrome c oxidase subunit 3 [Halomonas muralis]SDL29770.1 cytochrome c oxidase cbb3-type subunit 4 [Halomonas muralis]
MDIGTFRGITTLLVLFCFLGIVFWAYSKRRKKDFDEAKNLPFADEEDDNKSGQESDTSTGEIRSRSDRGDNDS